MPTTTRCRCSCRCSAAVAWLGWNKALDIVEHPDEAVRERERQGLNWWLGQARLAFETGDI